MLFTGWIILNVIQASGMELDPDEAYYWLYSKQLAWGYFDHPPVIALLIKLGYAIIPRELGVRLGAIILQAAGFVLIWNMLDRPLEKQKVWLLALLLTSLPMLQIYGFIATPDSPLLFFVILFFYCYRRFLQDDNWGDALLLGLVMSLMLYSKYHGLLVILFTLFSNWQLLLNPRFYLASIFGAGLFLPHLYWQYDQGFPSFSYHLVGRDDAYELKYTVTYLINQVVILSPFLFPLFITVLIRRKPSDLLERAFYFVIYGFWIFFFFSTFKGHAEPQWTAVISIPLVILAYRHALAFPRFAYWLKRMATVTLILLFVVRLFLLFDSPQLPTGFQDRPWIEALQNRAAGRAIIFENSYRDVSKYTFYAQERAYTFTDIKYRKNQFDIWQWEEELHQSPVLLVGKNDWNCSACKSFKYLKKEFKLKDVSELTIAQKLQLNWDTQTLGRLEKGAEYSLDIEIVNPYKHDVILNQGQSPVRPVICFLNNGEYLATFPLEIEVELIPAQTSVNQRAKFLMPDTLNWENGRYQMGIGISLDNLPPVINSRPGKIDYSN